MELNLNRQVQAAGRWVESMCGVAQRVRSGEVGHEKVGGCGPRDPLDGLDLRSFLGSLHSLFLFK